jgi:hypothetical protein
VYPCKMTQKAKYFRRVLMAVLLVLVWLHSHWAVALALTVLFIWHEFSNYIDDLLFNELFLYASEYWRARMCPDEAAARLAVAKHIYGIVSKERFKAMKAYNDLLKLYEASINLQPDVVPTAVKEAKECSAMAEEKASRAYDNLRLSGGDNGR